MVLWERMSFHCIVCQRHLPHPSHSLHLHLLHIQPPPQTVNGQAGKSPPGSGGVRVRCLSCPLNCMHLLSRNSLSRTVVLTVELMRGCTVTVTAVCMCTLTL